MSICCMCIACVHYCDSCDGSICDCQYDSCNPCLLYRRGFPCRFYKVPDEDDDGESGSDCVVIPYDAE